MMIDIYALAPHRNLATIARFLELVAPERWPAAEEYPVPAFSDSPTHFYVDVERVIDHLIADPTEPYAIYWRQLSAQSAVAHAMLFFTGDGHLIFGISVWAKGQLDDAGPDIASWLQFFADQLGSREGYALFDTHPEYESKAAFLAERALVPGPNLVAGIVDRSDLQSGDYLGPAVLRSRPSRRSSKPLPMPFWQCEPARRSQAEGHACQQKQDAGRVKVDPDHGIEEKNKEEHSRG